MKSVERIWEREWNVEANAGRQDGFVCFVRTCLFVSAPRCRTSLNPPYLPHLVTILHSRPTHRHPRTALVPTSTFLVNSTRNSALQPPSYNLPCFHSIPVEERSRRESHLRQPHSQRLRFQLLLETEEGLVDGSRVTGASRSVRSVRGLNFEQRRGFRCQRCGRGVRVAVRTRSTFGGGVVSTKREG